MKINNPFRRSAQTAPDAVEPLPKGLTAAEVWDAPAQFNRRTRRAVGMFGRIWKWDLNASDETRRAYMPRYIRRHFKSGDFTHAKTRRQRRHRARVLRIVKAKGIA